ncbi:tripartite motif-containing protein 16-like isoform X2 [Erpetoichthys calabaricus]|uniref:tripartite motif-containing protein 16-like isoform X2 n=1 Tax=Erpetoichthys calabaricus TaxID=27687 RepID=UPI002234A882|nr:tripartite motif-containing protein 16-like isoform X2 [Erpetoichthys calabaricus]
MAETQLFVSQDEFTCSMCLDTLTDPVSLHCGHSFCLKCLTDCWDQSQECSCPQCRHTFTTRPELNRNTLLNEVIKKLKKTTLSSPPSQNFAGHGDVECDFCTGKKFRAVKSCLTCMASYCQTHLQPHYEGDAWKGHKLVDPDRNLKEKLCEKHQKSLEIFCQTDDSCICMMCVVTGHKNHEMVELETEREEKQKQLGETLSDIKRGLEEREKTLKETRRAMEEMKISVERDMEENEKSFTVLIQCIEEAHKKLTETIREQEKRETEKAEGVMEQLEKEIEELKKREAELKELSETKDHLHFLQTFSSRCVLPADGDSLSFTVTTDFSSEDLRKELSGLTKSLEKIIQWDIMTRTQSGAQQLKPSALGRLQGHQHVELNTSGGACTGHYTAPHVPGLTVPHSAHPLVSPTFLWQRLQRTNAHEVPVFTLQPPEPQSRHDFLKYFCPLTLDINTANKQLRLSKGNKKVTREGTVTRYPDHPDRFEHREQVLCRKALTGTRCYWEVECSGDIMRIGVAYKGLGRKGKGKDSLIGCNNKSWCLQCSHSQYSVLHNYKQTEISAPYSPRIGVYLDWPAGSLSFYSVSLTMTLLHRFNTYFTELLYPGFGLNYNSSVTINHLTPCDQ